VEITEQSYHCKSKADDAATAGCLEKELGDPLTETVAGVRVALKS
jgi:hypothetical protein